jgi:excinuclease UvrABC ATPase subunit
MNAMINSDNGQHSQSPHNNDEFHTCVTCEGTGRVTILEDSESVTEPCEDCKGEGFRDTPTEGWFNKPKKVEAVVLESWEKELLNLALKYYYKGTNEKEITKIIISIKNKLKL